MMLLAFLELKSSSLFSFSFIFLNDSVAMWIFSKFCDSKFLHCFIFNSIKIILKSQKILTLHFKILDSYTKSKGQGFARNKGWAPLSLAYKRQRIKKACELRVQPSRELYAWPARTRPVLELHVRPLHELRP